MHIAGNSPVHLHKVMILSKCTAAISSFYILYTHWHGYSYPHRTHPCWEKSRNNLTWLTWSSDDELKLSQNTKWARVQTFLQFYIVRPAKTQISLCIRTVWSVISRRLEIVWVFSYPQNVQRRFWTDLSLSVHICYIARNTVPRLILYRYSRLSLSRPRLSRITAYLEVKLWSLF